jgi:hypothetical protein
MAKQLKPSRYSNGSTLWNFRRNYRWQSGLRRVRFGLFTLLSAAAPKVRWHLWRRAIEPWLVPFE